MELRVHGVSGTPPESMLACHRVTQVNEEELGRFFRPADDAGRKLSSCDHDGPDGHEPVCHTLEAYHWGRFTSGSWKFALWLLLAPFGIVNTAQFMLESPGPASPWNARTAHTVAGAALRLIGLALTSLLVLTVAVLSMDLLAWQRIPQEPDWLNWLPGWAWLVPLREWATRASPVLALFAPVVIIVAFGFLGKDGASKSASHPPGPTEEPMSGFMLPGFFEGDSDASALRLLHVAAGLGLVALLGFAPARGGDDVAQAGFRAALLLLTAVVVIVTLLGDPGHSASIAYRSSGVRGVRAAIHAISLWVAWSAALIGALLVLGATWLLYREPTPIPAGTTYPEVDTAAYVVMIATVTGMVVLLLSNLALAISVRGNRSPEHPFRPFAWGMAAYVVASFGVFLAVGYTGAFVVTVANALSYDDAEVRPPQLMRGIVQSWGITAAVVVLLVVVAAATRYKTRAVTRAVPDFEQDAGNGLPMHWRKPTGRAIWDARLKNQLVPVLSGFAVLGILLSLASVAELRPESAGFIDRWPGWLRTIITFAGGGGSGAVAQALVGFGGVVLALLATQLLLLGRTAVLSADKRRTVNVLWDVIAFWPRAVHPLVPAAYSQRAVNNIQDRLLASIQLEDGMKQRVVLCGHSQGSLMSFAALVGWQDQPERLGSVGLLTYGSQLQLLFARAFPAYVNIDTICWLYKKLAGRWRNLYRDTDYMAGPVLSWNRDATGAMAFKGALFTGALDDPPISRVERAVNGSRIEYGAEWKLLDPPLPAVTIPALDPAPLRKHSDYWLDAAWVDAVGEVLPLVADEPSAETETRPGGGGPLDVDEMPGG